MKKIKYVKMFKTIWDFMEKWRMKNSSVIKKQFPLEPVFCKKVHL